MENLAPDFEFKMTHSIPVVFELPSDLFDWSEEQREALVDTYNVCKEWPEVQVQNALNEFGSLHRSLAAQDDKSEYEKMNALTIFKNELMMQVLGLHKSTLQKLTPEEEQKKAADKQRKAEKRARKQEEAWVAAALREKNNRNREAQIGRRPIAPVRMSEVDSEAENDSEEENDEKEDGDYEEESDDSDEEAITVGSTRSTIIRFDAMLACDNQVQRKALRTKRTAKRQQKAKAARKASTYECKLQERNLHKTHPWVQRMESISPTCIVERTWDKIPQGLKDATAGAMKVLERNIGSGYSTVYAQSGTKVNGARPFRGWLAILSLTKEQSHRLLIVPDVLVAALTSVAFQVDPRIRTKLDVTKWLDDMILHPDDAVNEWLSDELVIENIGSMAQKPTILRATGGRPTDESRSMRRGPSCTADEEDDNLFDAPLRAI